LAPNFKRSSSSYTFSISGQNYAKGDNLVVGLCSFGGKAFSKEYYIKGSLYEIYNGHKKGGKLFTYFDIPTQDGHAGAPVFRYVGSTLQLFAIHIGVNELQKFGVATVITHSMMDWIRASLKDPRERL
jgi:hypothetical protein